MAHVRLTSPITPSAVPTVALPATGSLGPVPQRRSARLGDTVVEFLVDRIVAGVYPPDTQLPVETELCDEFGVSRTVVRESIKLLEEKGLVRAAPRRGTRVRRPESWNLLDLVVLEAHIRHDQNLTILDELVSVRVALECEMAAQAARRIGPNQLSAMTEQVALLASSIDDPARYGSADIAFHDLIMAASGNRLGRAIISGMHGKARLSDRYNGTPERTELERSLAEHQEIARLIEAGDANGVASAMRAHITDSWTRRRPRPNTGTPRAAG